mgnify:CR=1 FL=1
MPPPSRCCPHRRARHPERRVGPRGNEVIEGRLRIHRGGGLRRFRSGCPFLRVRCSRWCSERPRAGPSRAAAASAHALLLVLLLASTRGLLGFVVLDRVTGGAGLASIDGRTFAVFLAIQPALRRVESLGPGAGPAAGARVCAPKGPRLVRPSGWARTCGGASWAASPSVPSCSGLMVGAGAEATEVLGVWGSAPAAERLLIMLSGHRGRVHRGIALLAGTSSLRCRRGSDAGRGWSSAQRSSPCTTCDFRPGVSPGKAIFGGVFGLLRMRTGRLVAPAVAHWISWAVMGFPLKRPQAGASGGVAASCSLGTGAGERMTDCFDAPGDPGLWHEGGSLEVSFDARRG